MVINYLICVFFLQNVFPTLSRFLILSITMFLYDGVTGGNTDDSLS